MIVVEAFKAILYWIVWLATEWYDALTPIQ